MALYRWETRIGWIWNATTYVTQDEYDLLPSTKLTNNVNYWIYEWNVWEETVTKFIKNWESYAVWWGWSWDVMQALANWAAHNPIASYDSKDPVSIPTWATFIYIWAWNNSYWTSWLWVSLIPISHLLDWTHFAVFPDEQTWYWVWLWYDSTTAKINFSTYQSYATIHYEFY